MCRQRLGPIALALLAGFAAGMLSNLVWTQPTVLAQSPPPADVPTVVKAREFQLISPLGKVVGELNRGHGAATSSSTTVTGRLGGLLGRKAHDSVR